MIAIGADHGGVDLKRAIVDFAQSRGEQVEDVGAHDATSVDYPDYGRLVAARVAGGTATRGILICTSGIGMSIVANKYPGVRAALVHDPLAARMSREHNDANVLVLAGGFTGRLLACEVVRVWLDTPFAGGRHQRRVDKIAAVEAELAAVRRGAEEKG